MQPYNCRGTMGRSLFYIKDRAARVRLFNSIILLRSEWKEVFIELKVGGQGMSARLAIGKNCFVCGTCPLTIQYNALQEMQK